MNVPLLDLKAQFHSVEAEAMAIASMEVPETTASTVERITTRYLAETAMIRC